MSIDEICASFQSELESGRRPRIEKILSQLKEKYHERVLRSLLITEISFLRRKGEGGRSSEYRGRFPEYRTLVDEVFSFLGPEPVVPRRTWIEPSPPEKPGLSKQVKSADTSRISTPETKAGKGNTGSSASRSRPAEIPAQTMNPKPEVSHFDEDLESLLAVSLPIEPVRKKTPEEIEEARERQERRKARQKEKDRAAKRVKVRASAEGPSRSSEPIEEFRLPLIIAIVSGVLNIVTAACLIPAGLPMLMYIAIKLVFVFFSLGVTTGALFLAAALLGTHYGYLNTGLLKIAAICLTQGWLGDLAIWGPIPILFEVVAWGTTFAMFQLFFELDPGEVIWSMAIVRMAHKLSYYFAFAALVALVFSNPEGAANLAKLGVEALGEAQIEQRVHDPAAVAAAREAAQGDLDQNRLGEADESVPLQENPVQPVAPKPGQIEPAEADGEGAVQRGAAVPEDKGQKREGHEARYEKFGRYYANLLIVEDFASAYALTSTGYRSRTTPEEFKQAQVERRAIFGIPLSAKVELETTDRAAMGNPELGEDLAIPLDKRLAIIHMALKLDISKDESEEDEILEELSFRLLLVDDAGKIRIEVELSD